MKHKPIFITLFVVLAIALIVLVATKAQASPVVKLLTGGAGGGSPTGGGGTLQNDGSATTFPLTMGSTGKAVKMLQAALGIDITGMWDSNTDNALNHSADGFFDNAIGQVDQQSFLDGVANLSAADQQANFPLQNGSNNGFVTDVQILLSVQPYDGIWGPITGAAVQKATGKTSLAYQDYVNLVYSVLGINGGQTAAAGTVNTAQGANMANTPQTLPWWQAVEKFIFLGQTPF